MKQNVNQYFCSCKKFQWSVAFW